MPNSSSKTRERAVELRSASETSEISQRSVALPIETVSAREYYLVQVDHERRLNLRTNLLVSGKQRSQTTHLRHRVPRRDTREDLVNKPQSRRVGRDETERASTSPSPFAPFPTRHPICAIYCISAVCFRYTLFPHAFAPVHSATGFMNSVFPLPPSVSSSPSSLSI